MKRTQAIPGLGRSQCGAVAGRARPVCRFALIVTVATVAGWPVGKICVLQVITTSKSCCSVARLPSYAATSDGLDL